MYFSLKTYLQRKVGDQRNPFLNTMIWQENTYVFIFNQILKKITCMYFSLDTDSEDYQVQRTGALCWNHFLNTMIWQENIYVFIFWLYVHILKKITCMYFSLDTDSEDHSSAAHGSPSAESFDAKSYGNISPNRSFNNYVHIILTFFWPLAYTYLLLRGYFCP